MVILLFFIDDLAMSSEMADGIPQNLSEFRYCLSFSDKAWYMVHSVRAYIYSMYVDVCIIPSTENMPFPVYLESEY